MNNPSEKIKKILDISERLSVQEWAVIDLTLRQFGLPTQLEWHNNNKKEYIIEMIENGSEEILSQLLFHLTGEKPKVLTPADFWQPGQFRLFISHISENKQVAANVQEDLERYHVSSFVAHKDIQPTKEWEEEIELALDTCDAMIALMTPKFHESMWTDQEIGACYGKGKLIIPVDFGLKPYGFLSKYQCLNGKHKKTYKELGNEIYNVLKTHNLTKRKMSSAIVNKFESSYSFDNARSNMNLVEDLHYFDTDLLERVTNAPARNYQLKDMWGIDEKIQRLSQKVIASPR